MANGNDHQQDAVSKRTDSKQRQVQDSSMSDDDGETQPRSVKEKGIKMERKSHKKYKRIGKTGRIYDLEKKVETLKGKLKELKGSKANVDKLKDFEALVRKVEGYDELKVKVDKLGDLGALARKVEGYDELRAKVDKLGDLEALARKMEGYDELKAKIDKLGDLGALARKVDGNDELRAKVDKLMENEKEHDTEYDTEDEDERNEEKSLVAKLRQLESSLKDTRATVNGLVKNSTDDWAGKTGLPSLTGDTNERLKQMYKMMMHLREQVDTSFSNKVRGYDSTLPKSFQLAVAQIKIDLTTDNKYQMEVAVEGVQEVLQKELDELRKVLEDSNQQLNSKIKKLEYRREAAKGPIFKEAPTDEDWEIMAMELQNEIHDLDIKQIPEACKAMKDYFVKAGMLTTQLGG